MEIQKFDRKNLELLRKQIDAALKVVGDEFEINLKIGNISFTDKTFHTKLTAEIGNALKENKTKQLESAFKMYAKYYGLQESDFNRVFTHQGTEYKIVGFDTKKQKNNIILERVKDGKSFNGSPEMITKLVK